MLFDPFQFYGVMLVIRSSSEQEKGFSRASVRLFHEISGGNTNYSEII
jgi:hypothetical protein